MLTPLLLCLAPGLSPDAWAAGTLADTEIRNTASASYVDGAGTPWTVSSNATSLRVDEVLGVAIASNDGATIPVTSPDNDDALSFVVTNVGNGNEPFRLAADATVGGDDYDPTDARVYLDGNANGAFDPGVDPPYVAGGNDPVLAPDQALIVFVTHDTPAGLSNGDVGLGQLEATAVTGSGAPGTVFAGRGDGGTDAVVGATTATASARGGYTVNNVVAQLLKTQTVVDPFGGARPLPGAVITYALTLSLSGTGSVVGARVDDVIPPSTTYVAGSLRLDGAALTDGADGDAGRFDGSGIEVDLGTLAAPAAHTITFQVRID